MESTFWGRHLEYKKEKESIQLARPGHSGATASSSSSSSKLWGFEVGEEEEEEVEE